MKIETREVKYHITLQNGDHVDVLMKQYVGVTNLILAIAREEKTWSIEGQHLFTDSSYAIPVYLEVTKDNTTDAWAIYDLVHASI